MGGVYKAVLIKTRFTAKFEREAKGQRLVLFTQHFALFQVRFLDLQ
jgi:hypothetical protein